MRVLRTQLANANQLLR